MPPEESTPQPSPESPSPAVEAPAPVAEPVTPPEAPPAPAEAVPATETAQPASNEPLPPEPEPFDSAQNKPTPEPPSSAASTPTHAHPIRDFLTRARVATQDRKRKKRDKIMQALTTKTNITNDEVEKLLHVSDATATRYLSALEKEGKIKQVGRTGKSVQYHKI